MAQQLTVAQQLQALRASMAPPAAASSVAPVSSPSVAQPVVQCSKFKKYIKFIVLGVCLLLLGGFVLKRKKLLASKTKRANDRTSVIQQPQPTQQTQAPQQATQTQPQPTQSQAVTSKDPNFTLL